MKYIDKPSVAKQVDIKAWESFFNVKMPNDLQELLFSSNGPILYDEQIKKELQFLSTDDAISFYGAYGFNEACKNALPILLDGSSNFAVYNLEKGEINGIYGIPSGSLWDDAVKIGDTINDLVIDKQLIEDRIHNNKNASK